MKKTRNYLNRNFKRERTKDKLSIKKRSYLMSKIRSRSTKFEVDFINALKKVSRRRFRTNVLTIKGKPDVVFVKYKVCVFLDSDFWHGWQYPRWKHLLKDDFWRSKIEKNRLRDKKVTLNLKKKGWKVLRFWEHQIKKDSSKVLSTILDHIKST